MREGEHPHPRPEQRNACFLPTDTSQRLHRRMVESMRGGHTKESQSRSKLDVFSRKGYNLTLPWIHPRGSSFTQRTCPTKSAPHNVEALCPEAFASRDLKPVPVCPTVPSKQRSTRRTRPSGREASMRSLARRYADLVPCVLANTVVFLPTALRGRTHRNAMRLGSVLEA